MKQEPYKRRPGDFEIRILRDGRLVFLSPDESLMDVAQVLDETNEALQMRKETVDVRQPANGNQ
jgi:hypothetical protein